MSARSEEIKKEVLSACENNVRDALDALEDGQYLKDAGYTDNDQEAIEDAHSDLNARYLSTLEKQNQPQTDEAKIEWEIV